MFGQRAFEVGAAVLLDDGLGGEFAAKVEAWCVLFGVPMYTITPPHPRLGAGWFAEAQLRASGSAQGAGSGELV